MLLFESFNYIKSICKKLDIRNYTINKDGSIDVDGDVDIYSEREWNSNMVLSGRLPLKFGKVTGDFYCDDIQLTTLEGSPREVSGNFDCSANRLITLEGSPREVGGDFYCNNNKLVTLEGGPREVGGRFFSCSGNPIHEVYKLFPNYKSYIDSLDYGYLRGTDIVRSRFEEALDEIGKKVPKSISGYKYIS